jgi:recombinational DNA repair protein (RecF pathway)
MNYLKYFEGFSMQRDNCDRCSKPTNGSTIMSMFNDEVICMKCKDEEKNDPDYKLAEMRDLVEYYTKLMNSESEAGNYEKAAHYKSLIDDLNKKIWN